MSDPLRRALRTLIQVGLVGAVIALYNAFAQTPLSGDQVAAIMAVATPLVSFAQNALEANGVPATLVAK